jgi:hypothetical protein
MIRSLQAPASAARPRPASPALFRHFTRGKERPRGVVWFGAASFYGHLRHLIASALLGLAGNHDWYDGLDGFRRMFRRRGPAEEIPAQMVGVSQPMIEQHAEWAREFVRGGKVTKPPALVLSGYTPVQDATYFTLRLTPGLDLLAVDRQLTSTDSGQRRFLGDYYRRRPDAATLAVLPDPVYPFGAPSRTGTEMVENLGLDLAGRDTFVLSGDIHHYERLERGKQLHVIAGGGGAFLHPARIARGGLPRSVVWPDVAQCRWLLRQVPWKLARGRSGFLPHFGLLALFTPAVALGLIRPGQPVMAAVVALVMTLLLGGIYALIGGVVQQRSVLP